MTVYELLERRARDRGDQPFLVGYDRTLSASEMLAASDEWSGRLERAGVKAGDRVLLRLPNSPEFLAIWFGLIRERACSSQDPPLDPSVSGLAADRYGAGQQGSFEGDRTDRGVREVRETEQAFRLTGVLPDETHSEIACHVTQVPQKQEP